MYTEIYILQRIDILNDRRCIVGVYSIYEKATEEMNSLLADSEREDIIYGISKWPVDR